MANEAGQEGGAADGDWGGHDVLSYGRNEGRNDRKGRGKLARGYLKNIKRFQVASWLIHAWPLIMRWDFGGGIKGLIRHTAVFFLQATVEQAQLSLLHV